VAWTERYMDAASTGGDGTTSATSGANAAWNNFGSAITGIGAGPAASPTRINIKAGTYANTTTTRTFNTAGATTAPVWWRGYSSSPGDLDSDFTTAKPSVTFTTGQFSITGAHQMFSNLAITGTGNTATLVSVGVSNILLLRLRVDSQNANASASAVSLSNAIVNVRCINCYMKASTTATTVVPVTNANLVLVGCTLRGGGNGITTTGDVLVIQSCCLISLGADGVRLTATTAYPIIIGNTFQDPGGDGIEITAAVTKGIIAGNIFDSCAVGINNSTGTNTNTIARFLNCFRNCTNNEVGFGDAPSILEQAESVVPFVNAPTDLTLIPTAVSRGIFPGLFENESFTGYGDLGGVQRPEVPPFARIFTGL